MYVLFSILVFYRCNTCLSREITLYICGAFSFTATRFGCLLGLLESRAQTNLSPTSENFSWFVSLKLFLLVINIWAATWKTNKMSVRPAKSQISLGIRPVWSETSLSAWRNLGPLATYPLSAQRRLCSDWADAQADLSLRWPHSHFVGFVMSRIILGSRTRDKYLSRTMRNLSYVICKQQRRRSACASAQSDQRLCCSLLR